MNRSAAIPARRLIQYQASQDNGAFADYALLKDGLFIKVPDSMSMEDASTLGVGVGTVGQVCFDDRASKKYLSNIIGSLQITQATLANISD